MRYATIVLVLVAALAAAATGALAAHAGKDAKSLALRASDFPPNAQRMGGKAITAAQLDALFDGARGQAYVTTFQFPSGQKREIVMDVVVAAESAGQARTSYAAVKKEALDEPGIHPGVRLPAYGDEQFAAIAGDVTAAEAGVVLVVRKGSVVWELRIDTDPLAKDFGLSKAQALAELQKYAARQKLRVAKERA